MKNNSNRKKIKFKKSILVLFVLLIGIIYYFTFPQNIRSIFINGNKIISNNEIINLAGLNDYPNIFFISERKINNNLKKNSYIKNAKIKKSVLYELYIEIEEYIPLFIDTTGSVVLNNKKIASNDYNLSLPTLTSTIPNNTYDSFIKGFVKIDENIRNKISEIKYDPNEFDKDRFLLYMDDRNYVYITLTKIELLNEYLNIITKLEGKRGILYLDSGNYFKILE